MLRSHRSTQTTLRPSKQRLVWIDFLRGTAVLFVILNHAIGMTQIAGWPLPLWLGRATQALEPFRLPMLLIVSGMFLPRALGKPLGIYVDGKVRNLLWPLLLWTPVTIFAHIPDRAGDPAAWVGPSHLWYLKTLVFCYAVALLSRWIPLWVFPVAFLTALFTGLTNDVNLFWFGSFFFIGAIAEPLVERLQRSPRWAFWLLLGGTVIGSALHVGGITRGQSLAALFFSLVGVAMLAWLAPRIPRTLPVLWMERMGRRSIVYYVVHLPVMALLLTLLAPLHTGTFTTIAIIALFGLAVPFAMCRVNGHEVLFSMPQDWYRRVVDAGRVFLRQGSTDKRGDQLRGTALNITPVIR